MTEFFGCCEHCEHIGANDLEDHHVSPCPDGCTTVRDLTEFDRLLADWRNYVARQQHKHVQDCSPGYLTGVRVCTDQLESVLRRMKDDD